MDSSNSGSFQSSSGAGGGGGGGDTEEYDSRTHSISSFFNPSNHFNPNLNNHLLHPQPQQLPSSSSSASHHHNNQHHINRPPPTDTTTFFNPSPFSPNTNPLQDPGPASTWTGTIPPSRADRTRGSDHLHPIGVTLKNPKKRTRASRRAPTTVLTTDTTNFRQMVQEFTGIPTSPFAATGFSRRLDLFRPTAQKLQQQHPPPFLNHVANNINNNNNNNITAATSSSSFQLHPSTMHEFQKQPSTLLDLQNPMLSFQSLLQTSLPQQPSELNGLQSSASNSWRDQSQKLDSGLENVVVAASGSGGDHVQGNQGSWMNCPSN